MTIAETSDRAAMRIPRWVDDIRLSSQPVGRARPESRSGVEPEAPLHHSDGHAKAGRTARSLAVAGLVPVLLFGCGRGQTLEVGAAPPPVPAPAPGPPGPPALFQGEVAAVDAEAGRIVVAVHMVWAPVFESEPHERVVVVEPQTLWEPAENSIALLHVGDEVQVEAVEASDGSWHASKVQLFDVD